MTLLLTWTEEEAARYLETYKALDGTDASLICRKEKTHFADQAADLLAGRHGVNKTDAASLLAQFGSVKSILAATKDELGNGHRIGTRQGHAYVRCLSQTILHPETTGTKTEQGNGETAGDQQQKSSRGHYGI
jgi:ERCC4-type nuclease